MSPDMEWKRRRLRLNLPIAGVLEVATAGLSGRLLPLSFQSCARSLQGFRLHHHIACDHFVSHFRADLSAA